MEVYWNLASADAFLREAASITLVTDLRQAQLQHENGALRVSSNGCLSHDSHETLQPSPPEGDDEGLQNCAPPIQYALKRLLRGVGSSRESARQGFAMALASILESLPCIEIKFVLKLMKKHLDVTSSMKGQEKRDGLLGQLFALGAIVTSGKVAAFDEAGEAASLSLEITERLLTLSRKKMFLREPAFTVLLHLIHKLPTDRLQDCVYSSPLFQEVIGADIENQSADSFLLVLHLWEKLPASMQDSCPLLPNSHDIDKLFDPSHVVSLLPVLKDSSICHPRVHPVWNILIDLLFTEVKAHRWQTPSKKKRLQSDTNGVTKTVEQRVASFWDLVVDKSLLPSSHERKYLVMELLQLVLPKVSGDIIYCILSETLVHCLIDNLVDKGTLLSKSAQKCLDYICEWAKSDESRATAVILTLQYCSHGKFDSVTRTQTVKGLMSVLKSLEGSFMLYKKLAALFYVQWTPYSSALKLHLINGNEQDMHNEMDRKKPKTEGAQLGVSQSHWVLDQLYSFVKQSKGESAVQLSLQKEFLKFLTVNSLFTGSPQSKCIIQGIQEEVEFPEMSLSEVVRNMCLARLQSVLVDVSQKIPTSKDKKVSAENEMVPNSSFDPRFFFLELCDELEHSPGVKRIRPFSEDDRDVINALRSCMSQLFAAAQRTESEKIKRMKAMSDLLMQIILRSVTSEVVEIAAELILCCKRAFGDVINIDIEDSDEIEEMPAFIDVLVDILLSLLAESSAPMRAAVEQVFKCFCADLTELSMLSLLRVVEKQLGSGKGRTPITSNEGERDEDDDDILEVEGSDDDGDKSSDEDDDSDLSDHNEEKPNEKSEVIMPEDDSKGNDSGADSDMDDEAMFRIDKHLVNLLKQRGTVGGKGEGQDAQTQLLHFKFRVLSLLQFFFCKESDNPLCLMAVPHLLEAFVLSSSTAGNAQLAEKISSILRAELFKSKKYPKGCKLDIVSIDEFLQKCLTMTSRSKIKSIRELAQACSLWLLKVLHGQQLETVDGLNKRVNESLNDFFFCKKSFLKESFFQDIFKRFPRLGTSNLDFLLDRCLESRTECLQHQAMVLVTTILQLNIESNGSKQRNACIERHAKNLRKLLVTLIEKPSNKRKRKAEARRFCLALLKFISQGFPEPLKKFIGKSTYNLCLNHFGPSIIENICRLQKATKTSPTAAMESKSQFNKSASSKQSKNSG